MQTVKKIIILLVFLQVCLCVGQQDAQYSQYMYNTLSINPAYAGSREAFNVTGIYRNQWIGVGGAPVSQTFNVDTPLGKNNSTGIGFSVIHDRIGPTSETYFDIDYAHILKLGEDARLSLGLKVGGHLLNVDFNELNLYTSNDRLFSSDVDNKFSPNFGLGAYYRTNTFYAGVSAPNLLKTQHFDRSSLSNSTASSLTASERVTMYFISGYVMKLNEDLEFKPAGLVKAVAGAPLQLDLSANFRFKEKFVMGVAYRWSAAITALAALRVSKSIDVGLAYDWEVTQLGSREFNTGSLELFMKFQAFNNGKVLYPRFF